MGIGIGWLLCRLVCGLGWCRTVGPKRCKTLLKVGCGLVGLVGIYLPGNPSVPFFKATVAGFRGKVDGN